MINSTLIKYLLILMGLPIVISCNKKEDDSSPTTTNNVKKADYYFVATIDGKSHDVGQLIDGYGNGMSGASGGGLDSNTEVIQTSYFAHILDTSKPSYEVGLISLFPGYSWDVTIEQKSQAIQIGTYSYGKPSDILQTVEGGVVEIYHNGVFWATYYGIADQTGSSFEIIEVIDNPDPSLSKRIFKAKFNCTLYDGKGNSIKLTNGEIKGQIVIPWS